MTICAHQKLPHEIANQNSKVARWNWKWLIELQSRGAIVPLIYSKTCPNRHLYFKDNLYIKDTFV